MSDPAEPVLIVGGGPTGLAASLFLAWHDVPSVVLERRTRPSNHPRARAINPRTMELFRGIRVEDEIRASPSPIAGCDLLVHATSVAGAERMRMPTASPDEIGAVSPCEWMLIDQTQLEPILLHQARQAGVDVRLGTALETIEQDAAGVTATVRNAENGERYQIRAGHLIGADGAASSVRESLGIARSGPGAVTNVISVFFRADLSAALRGRKIAACYINNQQLRGTLIPIDNDRRWVFNLSVLPERGQDPEDFTPQRRAEAVRIAVGMPDLELKLEDPASPPWELSVGLAERFIDGRVLLAGDAAHAMPPTGAFGASTGIQDAHNLAWKIALVRRGLAGPALLASYGIERQAVAAATLRQAMLRFQLRQGKKYEEVAPFLARELTVVFGYRYPQGALVAGDDDQDSSLFEDPSKPTGRPGTRAPHVLLIADAERSSVLDLFGRSFVLLAGENGADWVSAATQVGQRRGLPIDSCRIDLAGDAPGLVDSWGAAYGVLSDGAVLIRPDGFIAWRSNSAVADPALVLDQVLTAVLDDG